MTLIDQPGTTGTPLTESRDPDGSRPITIVDPQDGSTVGTVHSADEGDVAAAVQAARRAAEGWAATAPAARGALLHAMADALAARADEVAALNTRETGKPAGDARGGVDAAVGTLRQYAELGPLHRTHSLRGADVAIDYTRPEPRGVVAAVTPWNDPVAVAAGLVGAALVTGNTVVHKPSERCPHVGRLLGEIWSSPLPEGVLTTLTGDGRTGAQLVGSAGVDVVAHVGSTATGRAIAAEALRTGAHTILENGGNDALLVDADVDPAWAAAQAALGAYANSGQICTSVERIYVHADVADAFVEALVAEAEQRNADGMAPLVDTRMRAEVHRQVAAAQQAGARVLVGGEVPAGPGAHYPATVVVDVASDTDLVREETFGPVAPVQVVASFTEGLDRAVASRYGLAATVLTGSLEHTTEAVRRLPVGTVKVNAVFGGAPGGAAEPRGASGHGFGYGPELLDEMTTRKVVHIGRPVLRTQA
ncbi:aldehyde dehydrogenase family protein [Microlunatus flavus]|uniref:Acyl-CoA reductase n=1 Tax=Microlunatus flavus TaxID=1036181 RepID=A0A1H8ZIX1_9ACTN|nr:aldehyde dehydrogenase family protein [Microlunatus flavus]SEP64372.1 Acyl-CoA reductase [Microlunatus flavus]